MIPAARTAERSASRAPARRRARQIEFPAAGPRRRPGTGRLLVRVNRDGREVYYGSWYSTGRRLKRRLGPKRGAREREGLTRSQAEQALREAIAATTRPPASARLTIAEVGARYQEALVRRGRKRSTRQRVESIVRVHLVPVFGSKHVDAFTHTDVERLIVQLERRGLAPATVRHVAVTLATLMRFAAAPSRRWVTSNPCIGMELPEPAMRLETRFLTEAEVGALLAHVRLGMFAPVDRPLYLTALMTGMRLGELVALQWQDVDWHASRIRVRRSYVSGEFTTPKSRRSARAIPMADQLASALSAWRSSTRWPSASDLAFAHPAHGGVLPKTNVSRRFSAALAAAGERPHRFHDLRHTFGTRVAAAGVPMRVVQQWMGHRDIATTQRYADYAPSPREAEMVQAAFPVEPRKGHQLAPS